MKALIAACWFLGVERHWEKDSDPLSAGGLNGVAGVSEHGLPRVRNHPTEGPLFWSLVGEDHMNGAYVVGQFRRRPVVNGISPKHIVFQCRSGIRDIHHID